MHTCITASCKPPRAKQCTAACVSLLSCFVCSCMSVFVYVWLCLPAGTPQSPRSLSHPCLSLLSSGAHRPGAHSSCPATAAAQTPAMAAVGRWQGG
jgi:hypothetical protein